MFIVDKTVPSLMYKHPSVVGIHHYHQSTSYLQAIVTNNYSNHRMVLLTAKRSTITDF